MNPFTIDSETCGFYSPMVLFQYQIGDGDIEMWDIWLAGAQDSIDLIETVALNDGGIIGFNLTFDYYHMIKIWSMLRVLAREKGKQARPIDHIPFMAEIEYQAIFEPCLKPKLLFDVMLHARKGPYQSMMDRKDIRIRRVPAAIANDLVKELGKLITFKPIYFARLKSPPANPWRIEDVKRQDGSMDPLFKNIIVQFHPSSALKTLAADALGLDTVNFNEIKLKEELFPIEVGWAPYASAIYNMKRCPKETWRKEWDRPYRGTWPYYIKFHVEHWAYNARAREYAANDVKYTKMLYDFFGQPEMGDIDSTLAGCVSCVRYRGFSVDIPKLTAFRDQQETLVRNTPTDPARVLEYIQSSMSDDEKFFMGGSTKKTVLEEIKDWQIACPSCEAGSVLLLNEMIEMMGNQDTPLDQPEVKCGDCGGTGQIPHPAAEKATLVFEARAAEKRIDLCDKLIITGRFHPDFKIIGAKSSRMSGTGGLNAQGINALETLRECFTLADEGEQLMGGDFDAFEVGIAMALYRDPDLEALLATGKKIHALFGEGLYPDETYDSIVASDKQEVDLYKRSKSALFAWIYEGNAHTLKVKLNIPEEQGEAGIRLFENRFPRVGIERAKLRSDYSPLRQQGAVGSKIEWNEPKRWVETLFGFKRYFDLEWHICKTLFQLANKPPAHWKSINGAIQRDTRNAGRIQTASGATQSALYGAAFSIAQACQRQAGNHRVQGTGSGLTKRLQCKQWELQPAGVHPYIVRPMNVHDEILNVTAKGFEEQTKQITTEFIQEYRSVVPLLGMTWGEMETWKE